MKHALHCLIFFRERIEPVLTSGLPNDHSTPSVNCRIASINEPTNQNNNNNNDISEFRIKSKKTFRNALPQVIELIVV